MSIYTARQERLFQAIKGTSLAGIALNPGPSLIYLTGLHFHLMERPVVALLTPGRPAVVVLPELEVAKLAALPYPAQAFTYSDDPATWGQAYQQAMHAAGLPDGEVGVEPTRLRFLELCYLEAAAPKARFISAEEPLAGLRLCKDADEILAMRKAVEIAQQALLAILPCVKIGVTERELASELTMQLLKHGSDPEIPFAPIVASGPNSANPHAVPSDRAIAAGDLLLFDWGAAYKGYISDLTRTFAIGSVEPELARIATFVENANAAGREAASRPGATADQVDRAARAVIEQAGYGGRFTHRTGHGIGMESHEAPYIRAGNKVALLPGMTFTIEPGIYLPDRGGVRIEDNVVITAAGAECLSDLPRALEILG
jgi:Xaa-Pro dipeptidase